MSVHPCNRCGAQASSCECPDGPHHADGKGDVTAEITARAEIDGMTAETLANHLADASRANAELRRTLGVVRLSNEITTSELARARAEANATKLALSDANQEIAELRRTLALAKESNTFTETALAHARTGIASARHALQSERKARRALLTENDRLRAELAKRGPTLAEFIAWVDGFVRSSDAATGAVLNAAPSREIEDHVGRLDAACAAGASWRKLRAMIRAFESGVR